MLPFNDPNLQQGMPFNPNFNNQNAHPGNLNGNNMNNFHGLNLNPNLQPMAQNNQLGVLQLLALQLQNNPQLQINLLNQLQAQNLATFMGQNPVQNINPMMGLPNGQFIAQNQLVQGNQMMGLLGNPQLGRIHPSLSFGNVPNAMGQSAVDGSLVATPTSMQPMSPNLMKPPWNKKNMQQLSGNQQRQVNHAEVGRSDNSSVNSQISASKCSTRNIHGFGGESSHNRFQKRQLHDMRSSKGNMKPFNRKGGQHNWGERKPGQHNWGERKLQSTNSGEETPAVCQRPLPVTYSRNEIKQWLEARKKNFPTRANINKKLARGSGNDQDADSDAKLRRQQLKEVLAKQAELGVEVAEIPPRYLQEPENKACEENESKTTYGNGSSNRSNGKRGRGHGRDKWHSKRQKFKNKGADASSSVVKREPSLLKKLLSADIKRDKSRLLQVFRFMVLNDFFKQRPDKPLEFPVITVKDDGGSGCEFAGEKNPSLAVTDSSAVDAVNKSMAEEIGNQESSVAEEVENESNEDNTDGNNELAYHPMEKDDTGEQFEKLEEGEITD